MQTIEELIETASHDMFNPELNFKIAVEYEKIGQTSSAISFYLRAAEYGYETHPLIVYTSLIRVSYCAQDQSGREHTLENSLLQAVTYMPTRPEAYFVLSRHYERTKRYQACYTFAELGLKQIARDEPLPIDVEYWGTYCLEFEKAVSAYWIGRKDETYEILNRLKDLNLPEHYKKSIYANLSIL